MLYNFLPFITKHKGSLKYTRYLFSANRQHGSKPKKPLASKAKIFAASPALATNTVKLTRPNKLNTTQLNEANDESQNRLASVPSREIYPKETSNVNANLGDISDVYKQIVKPDVTITVPAKPRNENEKKQEIKLLNVVKSSDVAWHKQTLNLKLLPHYYMKLAKIRLTGLVVLTTVAGYIMAPGVVDPTILTCALVGTGLTSAAANTINQLLEIPYDSQMNRTKNRVLVCGLLSPLHALSFSACSATLGLSMLYFGANTLTMALGATNLILYTSVYTPLKRCSILNTWVGSVVGAIPPLIGWSACTGSLSSGAILMAAILYSWQFPHFQALSWNLRPDYSRAGYRMSSVVNPQLCRSSALRHSIAILALCSAAPYFELTTWTFAIDSLPWNCYLIYCAAQFYQKSDSNSSRKLFRYSLIHLPVIMCLMMIGKKRIDENKKDL